MNEEQLLQFAIAVAVANMLLIAFGIGIMLVLIVWHAVTSRRVKKQCYAPQEEETGAVA